MTNSIAEAITEATETMPTVSTITVECTPAEGFALMDLSLYKSDKDVIDPGFFQQMLRSMSPAFEESLQKLVDTTYWQTFNNLFRIATIIEKEYGVIPTYESAAEAHEAALLPDNFVFDKDTVAYTDAHETDGVPAMSPADIAAKRADGYKPLSNTQYQFLIETSERYLDGLRFLHMMKELGYQSGQRQEDIWQAAIESEKRRQRTWQERQELEQRRRKDEQSLALKKATAPGGMLDI